MDIQTINIGDLLKVKIHASKNALDDFKKRFTNTKESDCICEFEIFYKNVENIKKIEFGIQKKPFRNALYIVNEENDQVIAYSSKQQYSCENIVIRKKNKIYIFCQRDINSKVLIRVITELLIRKLLEKGFFPLHASCVQKNNVGTLFLGKKGSGKSIALFSSVLFDNALPISNDITFVGKENGIWQAFGLPYDITFEKFLLDYIKDTKNNYINNQYGSDKIRFDIAKFNDVFNTKWIWHAPISNINIVNLNKENEFSLFSQINPQNAMLYLKKYGKDDNFYFDDYLMINNLYPVFKYEQLAKEVTFNKLEGNMLKYYLRK